MKTIWPTIFTWIFHKPTTYLALALINTPLQRGDHRLGVMRNRFNGFGEVWKTVKTVSQLLALPFTSLKQGVNERLKTKAPPKGEMFWLAVALLVVLSACGSPAEVETPAVPAATPAANWPMFRGNPALTGVASGSLPKSLEKLW